MSSCGPPPPESSYDTPEEAFAAIQFHAREHGYAFMVRDKVKSKVTKEVYKYVYACDREGKNSTERAGKGKNPDVHDEKRRKATGSKKCDCKMKVHLMMDLSGHDRKWHLTIKEGNHNHDASNTFTSHAVHRWGGTNDSPKVVEAIVRYSRTGMTHRQVKSAIEAEFPVNLIPKDISNILQKARLEQLNGKSPMEWLLKACYELIDKDYHPSYCTNPHTNALTHLMFLHPEALDIYKEHCDILLLDCTYKTKRFNMPLLNICGMTGNNMVIQLGLVFLTNEKEEDYNWAMRELTTVMETENIDVPLSIVTDRELALINSLETYFPSSRHLLCRWHVNMNVLAKTKRHFPGPIRGQNGVYSRHPSFQAFLIDWNTLISCPDEASYNAFLLNMKTNHPATAISYVERTWLVWKEKLVKAWTDSGLHFGVTVTSPIEGCHSTLKRYLQRGNGDLKGVFEKLESFWKDQHRSIRDTIGRQKLRPRHDIRIPFFAAIKDFVHGFALHKILAEMAKMPRNGTIAPGCRCTIKQSMGLPCFHTLWERKRERGIVLLSDIHSHWFYNRQYSADGTLPPPRPVLEPVVLRRSRGRPSGALGGASRTPISSTRRDPSLFEIPSSSAPPTLTSATIAVTVAATPSTRLVAATIAPGGPSSTALALARRTAMLQGGHPDPYEPGTLTERNYMRGIGSIHKDDALDEDDIIARALLETPETVLIPAVSIDGE